MGEKNFGGSFPSHGKSSSAREVKKSPEFPASGKPKAKVNAGSDFPKTGNGKTKIKGA